MKSLQESLFDSDLVSKDTGYEYLYGLVDIASVSCDFNVEYLDVKKIKHDFNQIIKKFPPQDWSSSSVDSTMNCFPYLISCATYSRNNENGGLVTTMSA